MLKLRFPKVFGPLNQKMTLFFFPSGLIWLLRKLDFNFLLISLLGTIKVPTGGKYNGHAKTATLTEQLHSQQVSDAKNEQDYPKKLDQGFSFLFFSLQHCSGH